MAPVKFPKNPSFCLIVACSIAFSKPIAFSLSSLPVSSKRKLLRVLQNKLNLSWFCSKERHIKEMQVELANGGNPLKIKGKPD